MERTVQDGLVRRVASLGGPHLSAMRVRQCTEGALQVLSLSCANLRKLELPDLRGPFNDELIRALPKFNRLESLSLQVCFRACQHWLCFSDGCSLMRVTNSWGVACCSPYFCIPCGPTPQFCTRMLSFKSLSAA